MPEFIHDRAKEIMKSTKEQYGPEKGKQVAFAIATQQSHAMGKSPKTWHGKPFGTPEGRREAKEKYDEPSKMQKSADPNDPSLWGYARRLLNLGLPITDVQPVPGKWPPLPESPKVQPTDAKMSFTDPEFINTWKGAEGLAERRGFKVEDADPEQLRMGCEVEHEHTNDPARAEQIAIDHLAEIPDYYTRLKRMEKESELRLQTWATLDALRDIMGARG